jgi:hypothetical protein
MPANASLARARNTSDGRKWSAAHRKTSEKDLRRHRDREVSGVAKESGGIEWDFGRKGELEI